MSEVDSGNESFGDNDFEAEHLRPVDVNASKQEVNVGSRLSSIVNSRSVASSPKIATSAKRTANYNPRSPLSDEDAKRATIDLAMRLMQDFRKDQPDLPANPKHCFANNNMYSRGITYALFEAIPPKYHPLLDFSEYTHLAKDVDPKLLGIAAADRSADKVLLGLLRFPGDTTSKIFAPILFLKGQKKMEYIFTSNIVLDIHRVLIHGPSSLAEGSKPDPKAAGTKYGLVEATDHSIALAGLLARFLVSADKIFAPMGAITKINWESDYRTYRKLLASNPGTPFVKYIFKTINKYAFAGVAKTLNTEEEVHDADAEDEIAAAMNRLAFGDFDDDDTQSNGPTDADFNENGNPTTPVDHPIPSLSNPVAGSSRQVHFTEGPPDIRHFSAREEETEVSEVEPEAPRRSCRAAGSGEKGKGKAKANT
ncbi:hypothetical protein B0H17DRAFT_1127021 [Mycena rosella]|uniref:Uncharacterized protein n=1 Tax=Mycena rosella TaxID=1033263 RepID=A0AAD7GS04_MYCRO|nr:hypothetical protein B0H17DRAFT_1127021 [Mycena rosella]